MEVFCALDTRPKYHQVVAAGHKRKQLVKIGKKEKQIGRSYTHRNCGMLWRFAGHQIEYLLLDIVMCAVRSIARTRLANDDAGVEAML